MKKVIFILILLFLTFLPLSNPNAAIMEDYCVVPPYVIQNVPPNVMVVLDNSGSMFNFSYSDGFETTVTTDDNSCANSASPCTGFTNPGTYPTYKYYGYFNPDYWYDYTSNRFVPTAPKTGSGLSGERAKLSTEWDGSFLNWLTMRRVDIIRKVMTGGKTTTGEGAGYDRLIGEVADCDGRGVYKQIANIENYVDSTAASGTRCMRVITAGGSCNGSGSGTSSFDIATTSAACGSAAFGSDYNVAVRVPIPVEGVLQEVVGAKARLGLSFYKVNAPTPHGGFVQVTISGGSLPSTVNQINLTRPSTNTPLAETLWTEAGYFAQQASIAGGPGPRYAAADFQINNNVDPYNYGTGGQPRYPSCAKSFVLYITDGEPCGDGNLPATILDYANGRSNFNCGSPGAVDTCPAVTATAPETYSFPASTFPQCYGGYAGPILSGEATLRGYVAGIEDVALWAHTTDLRNSPTLGVNNMNGIQNLTLYAVFAFGKGSTLLRYAAINGGFEDSNANNIPDLQSEWDNNNDGEPDTFYEATDGAELEQSIRNAFSSILKRASSGTAASVLASGEGQGANLLQAVFYPRRRFGNDIISWTGAMQNLWFYLDPDLQCINIREDTNPDKILDLQDDYITQLYYDTTAEETRARRWDDSDGDGCTNTSQATVAFENLLNLWEAGKLLWERDITTDPRTIYTTTNGTSLLAGNFTTSNASALASYLQATDTDSDGSIVDDAENIIKYIHGEDITQDANGDGINDFRTRTVTIGSDTKVWKLGDILNSTPRIASWIPLNEYHKVYKDSTYGPIDPDSIRSLNLNKLNCPNCYYLTTTGYIDRGMVFAGGNDGMLHAFKLGKLELEWSGQGGFEKARLTGTDLGKEMWSFIPKGALPYLKYISDPDYCHIYTVDLSPFIFDASIGAPGSGDISNNTKTVNDWRTILIGGMRFGGACRGTTTACPDVSGDGNKDCVNTPVDVGGQSIGFSSYFALDITDNLANPANPPVLLWEFTDSQLGFATTGPAVVKIVPDVTKNGKWFAVFGSGPTGPINTTDLQFLGRSDQNQRIFILDLKDGSLERTIDTDIAYAFAGSMINTTYDHKLGQGGGAITMEDEAIYIGYTKRTGSGTVPDPYKWTNGGVGRLLTLDPITKLPTSDVNQWSWSTVIDNIGPVTTSVTHLYSKPDKIAWLFFGTGRYYYELTDETDDTTGERRLFGIKEPCVDVGGNFDPMACTTVNFGALTNVTNDLPPPAPQRDPATITNGWYLNLDLCTNSSGTAVSCTGSSVFYWTERTITDPVASPSTGAVFYTTYSPYNDECGIGGKTHLWAMKYSTGGEVASSLKGKALLQVSTAAIEEVALASAFTEKGERRTTGMEGVPPTAQGLVVIGQPKPLKRVIHIRER